MEVPNPPDQDPNVTAAVAVPPHHPSHTMHIDPQQCDMQHFAPLRVTDSHLQQGAGCERLSGVISTPLNIPTSAGSAAGSPTAASEYSVATTHGSTSSTVPFSRISQQRKQQERDVALHDAMQTLLQDTSDAFDLRMQLYTQDISTLQQLNDAAAQQYNGTAEIAAALGQFVSDLAARQAAVKEALAVLPHLDRQLEVLATAVSQLDKRAKQLEVKVGLKPLHGPAGSSSSSPYNYLTSSVSHLTAVGMSSAAAGLGCLGISDSNLRPPG